MQVRDGFAIEKNLMKLQHFAAALLLSMVSSLSLAQDCPAWSDKEGALRFLGSNKPHGTQADPECVLSVFATLSDDGASIESLVGLPDFERSTKDDDFKTMGGRYPAIGALMRVGKVAMPQLIKAIKENDSDLIRTNAAHTLGAMDRSCPRSAMAILDREAAKPGTTAEQQQRLFAARDYIGSTYPRCKSEYPPL